MLRFVALLLTVLTGFSGLVYEVTWQKYMATLLGSHSEATAAVLGIFLAGLSLGYSLFGRVTRRMVERAQQAGRAPRLLLAYGIIEAGIGVYALLFPWLFAGIRGISYYVPHGSGGLGFVFDVVLVATLLGPPTILMGGTIPILTQALSRGLVDASRLHALVYGFNTAGAFAGALAAGFFLVPRLGLAGTMLWMSAINLVAGGVFIAVGLRGAAPRAFVESADEGSGRIEGVGLYAFVALLSGFALMAIQTAVVRIGGLSLGSSEYTFSTVVAVFVLCIALGSFAVSLFPRLPSRFLIFNQAALVGLLFLLYGPLQEAPYWAHLLRIQFGSSPDEFLSYYLATFLGLLFVIGPAAALSGATLPLLFHHLRRQAEDLGAVAGRIYSWNTFGSLLGALVGGYALLFVLDLHHVFRIAIGALALGVGLLIARMTTRRAVAAATVAVAWLALSILEPWNPEYLTLGLFRTRLATPVSRHGIEAMSRATFEGRATRVLRFDDDPVATVTVLESEEAPGVISRSIVTNGKSDGSTGGDYATMALAALVPALFAEKAERSFVIGYGTGVTAGELAALETMREVVVAEISPAVVEAAPFFDFANLDVGHSPKLRVLRSDAYRALMRSEGRFDIIVSEPSNPWVTGVEMLYSQEFLQAARDRLSRGGVYVQWYHEYETDAASIALVLRTYATVFERVAVWYATGSDLLILGFDDPDFVPQVSQIRQRVQREDIRAGLGRARIRHIPALVAHELIPVGVIRASRLQGPIHTLYHPLLNHVAGAAFFRGARGMLPPVERWEAIQVGASSSLIRRYLAGFSGEEAEIVREKLTRETCHHRRDQCAAMLADWRVHGPASEARVAMERRVAESGRAFGVRVSTELLDALSVLRGPFESPGDEPVPLADARRASLQFGRFYQHGAPFDPRVLVDQWRRCEAPPGEEESCARGLAAARALLAPSGASP